MTKVLLDTDLARITQDDSNNYFIEVKPVGININPDTFKDKDEYLDFLGWSMRVRIDTLAMTLREQLMDDWSATYEQICKEERED